MAPRAGRRQIHPTSATPGAVLRDDRRRADSPARPHPACLEEPGRWDDTIASWWPTTASSWRPGPRRDPLARRRADRTVLPGAHWRRPAGHGSVVEAFTRTSTCSTPSEAMGVDVPAQCDGLPPPCCSTARDPRGGGRPPSTSGTGDNLARPPNPGRGTAAPRRGIWPQPAQRRAGLRPPGTAVAVLDPAAGPHLAGLRSTTRRGAHRGPGHADWRLNHQDRRRPG